MENYIGRECKGFRFEDGTDGVEWIKEKKKHIGEVGVITDQGQYHVTVDFNIGFNLFYPISLIEPHLIPETPEIPQLGEGIEMEVSDDGAEWCKVNIIARLQNGLFIADDGTFWKYSRPIPEVKKYTKEELIKIVGHDFEIV
jgi:hypothetical protein